MLLPLGEGVVADTFMGAGSTLAAAEALCYLSVGTEADEEYYKMASASIPLLARLYPEFRGESLEAIHEIQNNIIRNQNTGKQLELPMAAGR
ncbi:DNA methyltransferase [Desulfonema magnum]|uniref:SAM-dependent DNA methylase domain-containing protein n=1 Tax=Desulfonema magnum TaxID=45655 RepID=A0A975GL95_9BACT|nr:DNA methyltransferase [Desulfonema magnum]QTA85409.1 SAM-dependent DNA methylase domain-containing protein [Desulfonema magnum]